MVYANEIIPFGEKQSSEQSNFNWSLFSSFRRNIAFTMIKQSTTIQNSDKWLLEIVPFTGSINGIETVV